MARTTHPVTQAYLDLLAVETELKIRGSNGVPVKPEDAARMATELKAATETLMLAIRTAVDSLGGK